MMINYLGSLNNALHEILATDPYVYILGEDILDPYGGAFKVTKGLSTRYPGRVLATPISESAIVGIAGGMALRGLKPVVEIMFGDFIALCFDQIINHITKFKRMYGGRVEVPIVIRTPMGGGRGYGPTHSQSLEKFFFGVPHLKVVAPSLFHDPGEILKTAVRDFEPVLFIEHKLLYPLRLVNRERLQEPLRIEIFNKSPYPTVVVYNFASGRPDVVLITYGGGSSDLEKFLLKVADEEIKIVCFIPTLLNHLDTKALAEIASSASCGVIVLEEGTCGFNWGAEIITVLHSELGRALPPIKRLCSKPTVIPAAKELERNVLPSLHDLEHVVIEVLEQRLS
jgi:pyruvate/2-oxoglutarate/acetoin dehydrogenase E1 component